MALFAIDAGHRYDTLGKRPPDGSFREWQINDAIADELIPMLLQYENVTAFRTDDPAGKVEVSLGARAEKANAANATAFVSIHQNAFGNTWNEADGVETYAHSSRPASATELAKIIQEEMIQETGLDNRGVKFADFQVLKDTDMDAVLVECGFMTNRAEAVKMQTSTFHKQVAKAISEGLARKYNLKKKALLAGWVKENNVWFFYKNGVKQRGWILDRGVWYFLKSDGSMMANDWLEYKGGWYYLSGSGAMLKGLHTIKGNHYYFHAKDTATRKEGQMAYNETVEILVAGNGVIK